MGFVDQVLTRVLCHERMLPNKSYRLLDHRWREVVSYSWLNHHLFHALLPNIQPLDEVLRRGPRHGLVLLPRQNEDLLSKKRVRLVRGSIRGGHRVSAIHDPDESVGYMWRTER